ncbi:MAG: SPOR domain-containing protein [Mariprofundaceae bacterium]|nr:SPOR domain-containing protein [Mariprofundaceae bacterium]
MADQPPEDDKEKQKAREIENEIFAKTQGFVHDPDDHEFDKTVALGRPLITPKADKQEFDPAARFGTAQKPAAQKPAAQKPAAQKPAAQKPVAQKPVAPKSPPPPQEQADIEPVLEESTIRSEDLASLLREAGEADAAASQPAAPKPAPEAEKTPPASPLDEVTVEFENLDRLVQAADTGAGKQPSAEIPAGADEVADIDLSIDESSLEFEGLDELLQEAAVEETPEKETPATSLAEEATVGFGNLDQLLKAENQEAPPLQKAPEKPTAAAEKEEAEEIEVELTEDAGPAEPAAAGTPATADIDLDAALTELDELEHLLEESARDEEASVKQTVETMEAATEAPLTEEAPEVVSLTESDLVDKPVVEETTPPEDEEKKILPADALALASGDFEAGEEEKAATTPEAPDVAAATEETEPEIPVAMPAKETAPVTGQEEQAPARRRGAGFATLLGLIGFAVAAGALWMNLELTKRVEQLENSLADMNRNHRHEIMKLKQRLNKAVPATRPAASSPARSKAKMAPVGKKARKVVKQKKTITPATPAATVQQGGNWVINLSSFATAKAADAELKRLTKLGISVEKVHVNSQGKIWYRIRITGFSNAEQAKAYSRTLAGKYGIRDAWVGHK